MKPLLALLCLCLTLVVSGTLSNAGPSANRMRVAAGPFISADGMAVAAGPFISADGVAVAAGPFIGADEVRAA